jgi:aryl-alcohol dehydrogenase-like predicted oxidoreductase
LRTQGTESASASLGHPPIGRPSSELPCERLRSVRHWETITPSARKAKYALSLQRDRDEVDPGPQRLGCEGGGRLDLLRTVERRELGSSGIEVSRIGLGCMPMDWAYFGASAEDPKRVIGRAIDLGVTHLDTADVYGPFRNEETVGRAIEGRRDEVVLATKVGLVVGPNGGYPLERDARPERILREVDGSLRRLGTNVIDLYYLHRIDEQVPLEEQWGAMASLVQAGKVRALGLSEAGVEDLELAQTIHPVAALQSELSLWTRDALADVVPWCADNDVAFVPFSPLGRGFLTGTVTSASFEGLDFRATNPRFTQEAINTNLAIVELVRRIADRHNATPAQVAIAWCLAQGEHVVPIPGTKRVRYVEENVAAATIELTAEDLAALDSLPEASGARY